MNWINLLTNGLWIVGLAGGLATFSYYDYLAIRQREGRRRALGSPLAIFYFSLSASLFCLGMALGENSWPLRMLWSGLLIVFVGQAMWAARRSWQARVSKEGKDVAQPGIGQYGK